MLIAITHLAKTQATSSIFAPGAPEELAGIWPGDWGLPKAIIPTPLVTESPREIELDMPEEAAKY
jgi:hypothetical protein